jgi:hypothetical protein
MYAVLGLPFPTISHACQARRIGSFGLVGRCVTNPYHARDLGLGLPCCTFTNHYHRDDTTHIDIHLVASIRHQGTGWHGWHRVITV